MMLVVIGGDLLLIGLMFGGDVMLGVIGSVWILGVVIMGGVYWVIGGSVILGDIGIV